MPILQYEDPFAKGAPGAAVEDPQPQQWRPEETEVNPAKVDELFPYKDKDGQPTYRDGQRDTICEIIQRILDGNSVLADAPTGAGKSVLAHVVQAYLGAGAWGVTAKNVLVDQYVGAPLGWRSVMGMASYSCKEHRGNNCHKGTLLARAEGKIDRKEAGCSDKCPYRQAIKSFFDSEYIGGCMTNMHFLWYQLKKYEKANENRQRGLMVFDEAHLGEAALADMVKIVIKPDDLKDFNFDQPLADEKDIDRWLDELDEHMEDRLNDLYMEIKDLRTQHGKGHPAVRAHMNILDSVQRKKAAIESYTLYRNATQWIREAQWDDYGNLKYLKVEPVYGGFLMQKCLSIAPFALLMSATFLDKEMTCTEMRLDMDKTSYIRIPSTFPSENQPVYFDPSLRLNHKNMDENMSALVAKIDRILDYEQGKRGIIHAHSHHLTREIYRLSRHKRRFSVVEDGEKQLDAIQKHMGSKDSVLLGPGFVEGVDLKGDLGSFAITPKIPFPPMLGDRKLMIREHDHPGYCDLLAARNLIQGLGRVVRGPDEVANAYILDGALYRLLGGKSRRFFPDYFLAKIRLSTL